MTGENDTRKKYPIGSAEGRAEADRRIAEANNTGATAELDLGGLGLIEIPAGLFALKQLAALERLDLDKNQLSALPAEIGRLAALKRLYLNMNQLSALPAGIGRLAALEVLDLHDNQLSALPAEIGRLAALERLFLNKNKLSALPAEIGQLAALEVLDLNKNQLSVLPAEIGQLAALERLYLGDNRLSALPAEIGRLAALEVLDLSGNQLSVLPAEIWRLPALKRLDLRDNQLSLLPAEIDQLVALKRLDLYKNQPPALPAEIGQLAALELSNNAGSKPQINLLEAYRRIAEANNTGATELDLGGLGLLEIPAWFFALKQLAALERLDLSDNELSALPAEIGQLAALERLYLGDNQLSALPAEIGQLAALEVLYLYKNRLSVLPAEIGRLAALKRLDLNKNRLSALPAEIGQLAALEVLDLGNNQLSALPAEIRKLAALEVLDLGNNQLSALPAEIGKLAALKRLHLGNNRLEPWFEKVLAEGGIAGFRALLQALYENAAPLFEAKLLVTGAGKVGKSWALAALRGENPHETVGEQTTYGVYCGVLRLPHPRAGQDKVPADATIHLNTWDFGGQDVYRITHQFFFTQEAIFLLVWNPRDGAEKCGVREWLRMIELRTGGKAKVIIVASHSPREKTLYLPNCYRDRLPSELSAMIVDELAIDSELGDNIPELRAMIARHASKLRFMGDPFPLTWQKARQAVAALNPDAQKKHTPHITYKRFQALCQESGVSDDDQMFTLATVFMHNLGRAIYYGDRHRMTGADPLLANIMVLDSEWLSRAFVQVLEDKATNESGGMLDHAWLDRIWLKHGRADWQRFTWDEHPFLIRLMHAFDLSYVVRGSDGRRSLLPQLLPATEPELPWCSPPEVNGVKPVRLICRMENEPHGLMPRFIVQMAPYHGSCKAFWRDGVFLREPTYGNEALVTLEGTEKPVMNIAVSGAQPSWFLGELHRTL